ncbi:MAG: VCBS repeat-containing protein, partial [Proteobacteria bacterium]|nr:VCBS repeat-containing protein [Pseudomonadota bacterium]
MIANPTLTDAGFWFPVGSSELTANRSGALASPDTGLVPLAGGGYDLVMTGWSFASDTPAAPAHVSVGVLAPQAGGGMTLTTTLLSDPTTFGGQSVIVADFNGDGRPDIVLMAHNETPFAPEPSVAYMSNATGGFDKVTLPGMVMAHDAE